MMRAHLLNAKFGRKANSRSKSSSFQPLIDLANSFFAELPYDQFNGFFVE